MEDVKESRDWEIASMIFDGADDDVLCKAVSLLHAERTACMEIAARYGGRDADEIAEQIGNRSFERAS